jgi:hypothetical protein
VGVVLLVCVAVTLACGVGGLIGRAALDIRADLVHQAERIAEIRALHRDLPAELSAGPFTFDRWKLLDDVSHALRTGKGAWGEHDELIDVLVGKLGVKTPWLLLDGVRSLRDRAPNGGPVRCTSVLRFVCAECAEHRGDKLDVFHHTNGHSGWVEVRCPNGHELIEPNTWIS